jgi:hypothetical protein
MTLNNTAAFQGGSYTIQDNMQQRLTMIVVWPGGGRGPCFAKCKSHNDFWQAQAGCVFVRTLLWFHYRRESCSRYGVRNGGPPRGSQLLHLSHVLYGGDTRSLNRRVRNHQHSRVESNRTLESGGEEGAYRTSRVKSSSPGPNCVLVLFK